LGAGRPRSIFLQAGVVRVKLDVLRVNARGRRVENAFDTLAASWRRVEKAARLKMVSSLEKSTRGGGGGGGGGGGWGGRGREEEEEEEEEERGSGTRKRKIKALMKKLKPSTPNNSKEYRKRKSGTNYSRQKDGHGCDNCVTKCSTYLLQEH
jgi:hypothetical protein